MIGRCRPRGCRSPDSRASSRLLRVVRMLSIARATTSPRSAGAHGWPGASTGQVPKLIITPINSAGPGVPPLTRWVAGLGWYRRRRSSTLAFRSLATSGRVSPSASIKSSSNLMRARSLCCAALVPNVINSQPTTADTAADSTVGPRFLINDDHMTVDRTSAQGCLSKLVTPVQVATATRSPTSSARCSPTREIAPTPRALDPPDRQQPVERRLHRRGPSCFVKLRHADVSGQGSSRSRSGPG